MTPINQEALQGSLLHHLLLRGHGFEFKFSLVLREVIQSYLVSVNSGIPGLAAL